MRAAAGLSISGLNIDPDGLPVLLRRTGGNKGNAVETPIVHCDL